MTNSGPVKSQLSRRKNPKHSHTQIETLQEEVMDGGDTFFNVILPAETHAKIKLYHIFNGIPMSKIMTGIVVDWVGVYLVDLGDATKIVLPDKDYPQDQSCGIWLPIDVHRKIKLASSILKTTMRALVIPMLDAWIEENCTGPTYSARQVKAITQSA